MASSRPVAPPVRVVLACRDKVYAQTLAATLNDRGVEVSRFEDLEDRNLSRADVLLVELRDVGRTPSRLLDELRRCAPLIEVVAIFVKPVTESAVRALRSGVFAVLEYTVSADQVIQTVFAACSRKRRAEQRLKQLDGGLRSGREQSRPKTSSDERSRR